MLPRHQQVTGNINSFNSWTNYGSIVNVGAGPDAERQQILQWLSPLEPQHRHQGVRTDRLDGVGNWILETSEFRKWRDGEDGCVSQVLFCYGNPGVGKTYISSLVIDSLCDQAGEKGTAVVGLYCDFLAQQEQSTTNVLGAILKRLVGRGGIPDHIREAYQKAEEGFGGRGLRLPNMVEILKQTVASLRRIFVCIDALDELAPKHRRDLFESLQEMVPVSPNMRIFLTGRPHINDEVVESFREGVKIPVSPTQNDIKSYLEMRLKGDTTPKAMDDQLRADIMRAIPEKISEIFLLVSLNIDAILAEVTLHQRRKKLGEMTKGEGLGDAYAATISRIRAQPRGWSKLGMEVLMWVSHVERPLRVDELCHALGVEEGSVDLNIENIPAIETLLTCSLGLVTVEKSSSTVRLVHYTLQEYLSHNPDLFTKPHSMIAEACLTYLNFRQVRAISPTVYSVPHTIPFVEYASCHWGTHAKQETTESMKKLALNLLDGYDKHISSKMMLFHGIPVSDWPFDPVGRPVGFTGLHCAAYLGCVEIIVALLETNKCDVEATDLKGNTALAWAVRRGQEGVVRILLERNEVNPNTLDKDGQTPLSWAVRSSAEGVVRMLLERNDLNPNTFDKDSRTPLSWAVRNRHEGVVGILLGRSDVNPNTLDKDGQTPLSIATGNGYGGIVRTLLGRNDVNPDMANKNGLAPLSQAARNGHEAIVRMLLERNDANPNTPDKDGLTPLCWAAGHGNGEVVRILLERNDVNLNLPDICGRTPLSFAALNGYGGIVRMLLERDDVNPNTPDEYGRTPLSWTVWNGHEEVVRILLERSDLNPNIAGGDGRTPLSFAAGDGYEGVVRMLLGRNDVNPNTPDKDGQTPLSWAARDRNEEVVRMLLGRDDVNPNTPDEDGRMPLSWAAWNGNEGVVRILLERNGIDPNTPGTPYHQTPLSLAAENGHEGVVRMLLEWNDVGPHTPGIPYRQRQLLLAAENGHEGVVRRLLERGDVNPNTPDRHGQTPLSWAAWNGHEVVVGILLERNDVNLNTPSILYRQTPLSLAAENGHEGVVKMLLERKDVHVEAGDKDGQTPLSWAAWKGHEGVVRILLERNDVNPNTADKDGQTPLSRAAEGGHRRVMRILRGQSDTNPNTAG